MKAKTSVLHLHRWRVVPSFTTPSGSCYPPIWACPCGATKDMQSMADWGLA